MAKNEAKIKFSAETREFTAQIQQANSGLASMRAALALNEAEFKNTGNSAEYLKNKQQILTQQLQMSQSKQEALNQKLEAAKTIYGENSSEAQQWATKLTRAQTEEQKLQTQLNETNQALKAQESADKTTASSMDDLAEATAETGVALDRSNAKVLALSGMLANLASGAVTQVINKLKEAAKEVVKLGTDFTASLSNVQALSGATASEMAKLEARAKALGRTTVFTATDVSDAFGYMALAGWDVNDMLDGVDGVLTLAAASQMDLAKASDIVTDYLTAFGLSAQDSGKFVDQMAYAMSNSNTNTEQLGEAYKNVAATANSLHFSVEDTTAALMTMANAGIKGGEAGTGLNAIMTRLATNTKDCADELSKYGVEVYDANGNINSLSSILNGMAGVWGTLTDRQQANLAKTVAGQNQYAKLQTAMNGLSKQAAENGQSFNDYTEALENCEGAAAEMSATIQDNLKGDMAALGSAAQGLGLQLFELFDGPLRKGAQTATGAINAITDAITPQRTELQSFIEETGRSVEAASGILDNAKGIADSATERVGELEAYKNVLLDLNGQAELDEYQQYQLKNAVDALGSSVPGLSAAFDEATGTLNLTNKELSEMFNNAEALAMQQALIEAQAESYKALAEATIAKARADGSVKKASEDLADANRKNQESIEASGNEYGEYYNDVINASEAVEESKKQQEEAQKVMDEARESIETDKEALAGLAEEYGLTQEQLEGLSDAQMEAAEATDNAAEAVEGMADATGELSEEAQQYIEEVTQAFENMREGIRDSMQDSVSFMEEFSGGAEITAQEIEENLTSQIKGISNWSDNMQRLAQEAGDGMRQDMYDALVQMGPESANLVQELVDTLDGNTDQFRSICDHWAQAMDLSNNAEALAAATTAGKAYGYEVAGGMQESAGNIESAAQEIANAAESGADMSAAASKASETYNKGMETAFKGATKTVTSETNNMKSAASTGLAAMNVIAKTQFDKIKQNAKTAMDGAKQSVQSGVSAMRSALSVSLQGPHIKVPHFRMSGSFNAQTGAVPSVSVSYYAKGGIFTKPTFFTTPTGIKGVGEAGAEAVLPIDNLRDYIADAINRNTNSGNVINVSMQVDGSRDPEAWAVEFARKLEMEMRTG